MKVYYINRHSFNLFHSPSVENRVVTIQTFNGKSITITEKSYVDDFIPIAPFWRHLKSGEVAAYEDAKSESDIVLRYVDDAQDNKYHVTPKELMTEWKSYNTNPKELLILSKETPPFDKDYFKPGVWPEEMGSEKTPFEMEQEYRPTEIKILNLDYDIAWIDHKDQQEHERFGWCDTNNQRIKVGVDNKPKKVAQTFIHEVLHAEFRAMDLHDNCKQEDIVSAFSTALCALWQQNPEAMEWWKKMNTGG